MNEAQEVTIRTKDGMTYGYKNVKAFSVTPYDYQIIHADGSQRLINRAGIIDVVQRAPARCLMRQLQ
jgi:hypothetical protein